jgi:hypothetical protein
MIVGCSDLDGHDSRIVHNRWQNLNAYPVLLFDDLRGLPKLGEQSDCRCGMCIVEVHQQIVCNERQGFGLRSVCLSRSNA